MKKIIYSLLLCCVSIPSFGQSNLEKLDCESAALQNWTREYDVCKKLPNQKLGEGLATLAECQEKAAKNYVRNSCMPSLAMVVNNFSILWQQLKIINRQYSQKLISYDTAGSQSVMLIQTLHEQQGDYRLMLSSEAKAIRADEANKSSQRAMNLIFSGLNMVSKSGQTLNPTNMTYILNGRVYNCNTLGNITNCM